MSLAKQLGTALTVVLRVAGQGRFWGSLVRALFTVPIIAMVAVLALARYLLLVTPINVLYAFPSVAANILLILLAGALLAPLLARAWCPIAARAAADGLGLSLAEEPLPPYLTFLGWWLLMAVLLVLMAVPAVFVPRPFSMIMLIPAAIVVSGFYVRCVLCVHASAEMRKEILGRTLAKRIVIWTPLCSIPLYAVTRVQEYLMGLRGFAMDIEPTAATRAADLCFLVAGAAVFALVLVLWAALALQELAGRDKAAALGAEPQLKAPLKAAPAVRPRARFAVVDEASAWPASPAMRWHLPVLGVLLALSALGYMSRMYLLNWYLNMTDQDYAQEHFHQSQRLGAEQLLAIAMREAACRGNLERAQLIARAGVKFARRERELALLCAAGAGQMDAVRYLVGQGADVNATPRKESGAETTPVSALQMAVDKRQSDMVALLLEMGADPNLQSNEEKAGDAVGPLHLAAKRGDLRLAATLIGAGARPGAPIPKPPMFYYVEQLIARSTPVTPVNWELELTRALKAGLTLGGTDNKGANLLHMAATNGQFGLIDALLARGVEWRVPDNERSLPFMHLLAWYSVAGVEPGTELETALERLTQGLPNINVRGNFAVGPSHQPLYLENGFSVGRVASNMPRVRQLFGDRIDYSHLGGANPSDAWRFKTHAEAESLIADMTPSQLMGATTLIRTLQEKGWDDLALVAAKKR